MTVYRWVQRFTPLLADAAQPCRHSAGDCWFVDETYIKIAGNWRYVYRAVDQYGQIIDAYVSPRRDTRAARRFFMTALRANGKPVEVVTDRAPALRAAIDELIPAAFHNTEQYANNRIECDHGRLKARLRPMRGLKRDLSASAIVRGHALMQNVRRGALLHWRIVVLGGEGGGMRSRRCCAMPAFSRSAFAGFRFPPEIIVLALRWYLRYGLSYRDVEKLLGERGIEVDHVTVYRWVQRFTPLLAAAAGPCRHAVGDRWFVDETYVKVSGRWRYVYRAVDQYGQVIDVYVSARRDTRAAERFFTMALDVHGAPREIVTDRAPALRAAIDELMPAAFHNTEQYANNRIECDHGRLKARLRPMRGLKRDHSARVITRGHALMQNIRRGHYELGIDARPRSRVAAAFTELAQTI